MSAIAAQQPTRQIASAGTLLRNSVVAAVLGSGLMVLLHEVSHLVASLAMGLPATLYSFGVQHGGTPTQEAIAAAAGPVFSLALGGALIGTQRFWESRFVPGGFGYLLLLWFAYSNAMEGIGYLEITPLGAGDTATVVDRLGWPQAAAWGMFAVGLALQFLLAFSFARPVGRLAGDDRRARLAVTAWPWLVATAINVALALVSLSTAAMDVSAGEQVGVAAAGMAVLTFAPMALIFPRRSDAQQQIPLRLPAWPVAGIVALVLLVVVNLLLNRGLSVG